MKKILLTFLFLTALAGIICAKEVPVVLGNTQTRTIHSTATGRDYLLYIGFPDSYAAHPERSYPVVYLTDGYWNFVKFYAFGSGLFFDQIVPEYIVVGIGYAGDNVDCAHERHYELSPTVQHYGPPALNHEHMGGARAFLDSIKKEIIPFVETETCADPSFRVIAGNSLGGLFSLYAMYEEPGLFQGVIAASPVVSWDNFWIFTRANDLRTQALGDHHQGIYHVPARLFMSVGDGEWPEDVGAVRAFDEVIRSCGYADFAYQFRVIDGERHGGSALEAFQRGVRFVFEPMMPSPVIPPLH